VTEALLEEGKKELQIEFDQQQTPFIFVFTVVDED
jgi:hypothetical protein